MKKLLCLFAFMGLFALVSVNAQCTKSAAAAGKTSCTKSDMALKAAAIDKMIVKEVDATTQQVHYYKKSVCPTSGKVSFDEVNYCTHSKAFYNVAPSKARAFSGVATKVSNTTGAAEGATSTKKSCSKTCTKSKASTDEGA